MYSTTYGVYAERMNSGRGGHSSHSVYGSCFLIYEEDSRQTQVEIMPKTSVMKGKPHETTATRRCTMEVEVEKQGQ